MYVYICVCFNASRRDAWKLLSKLSNFHAQASEKPPSGRYKH